MNSYGVRPLRGLQTSTEVVGIDEVAQVPLELCVGLVVIALDSCFFDGAVHPLDLTIGPWAADLGVSMFDAISWQLISNHVGD
jgi:hypothetical protein